MMIGSQNQMRSPIVSFVLGLIDEFKCIIRFSINCIIRFSINQTGYIIRLDICLVYDFFGDGETLLLCDCSHEFSWI